MNDSDMNNNKYKKRCGYIKCIPQREKNIYFYLMWPQYVKGYRKNKNKGW